VDDRSLGLFNWQEMGTSSDNTVWQACLLAIVAGYADAVGFLGFNAFAGAMTGNTVLLGIALATDKLADAAQSVAIIAAFLAGVAASALLRRHVSLAAILVIEMAAIVVAALVTPPVAAPVLAFAMGLQNAAMTHFAGLSLNTVFLTGNLQKLVETLLRRDGRPTRPMSEGVAVALLTLTVSGCASIVEGRSQEISVSTDPPGAECGFYREEGVRIATIQRTPGSALVRKTKHDIWIVCAKPGYQQAVYFNRSGGGWTNVVSGIFTLGISTAIDSSTGSDNKYESPSNVVMVPNAGGTAEGPAALPQTLFLAAQPT